MEGEERSTELSFPVIIHLDYFDCEKLSLFLWWAGFIALIPQDILQKKDNLAYLFWSLRWK